MQVSMNPASATVTTPSNQSASRQLDAVYRITKALHSRTDLDDILEESLQAALGTVDAEAGSILLHDADAKALIFSSIIGEKAVTLLGAAIADTAGNAGSVFHSGNARINNDITDSGDYYADIDLKISFTTRNIVTLPLRSVDNTCLGVFQVLNKRSGGFNDSDLAVLTIVATLAGTAIDNARRFHDAKAAEQVHLLGDISHDLKNMLVPVLTGIDTLAAFHRSMTTNLGALRRQHHSPDCNALWADIDGCSKPFNNYFPDAVAMAIEAGERIQARVHEVADAVKGVIRKPTFAVTNVGELAQSVIRALQPLATHKQLRLYLQNTSSLCADVPVDAKRLYNAVYNLVDNAIAATAAGGNVGIYLNGCRNGKPFPDSDYLQITVRDDGCGIAEHIRNRMFRSNSMTTKPGGTGLGTCIVKNVVDLHGGTICVDSNLGKGTSISIRLPLTQ